MNLRKRGYRRRNISKKEAGQVEWMTGVFWLILLGIIMCSQLQIASWKTTGIYLEDALAASNLASALIDVEEYGKTHKIVIPDAEAAYEIFCAAVRENLQLDGQWQCGNQGVISGRVEIVDYVVYNVDGEAVSANRVGTGGSVAERWSGTKGDMAAPDGNPVECTGIYSEITFPVKGFLGLTVQAHKGKLVDIYSVGIEEEENAKKENDV